MEGSSKKRKERLNAEEDPRGDDVEMKEEAAGERKVVKIARR
jgi:hypothetical protein